MLNSFVFILYIVLLVHVGNCRKWGGLMVVDPFIIIVNLPSFFFLSLEIF